MYSFACFLYCFEMDFFFLFWFLKTGFYCLALAFLEITLDQRSDWLWLPNSGFKGVCQHHRALRQILIMYPRLGWNHSEDQANLKVPRDLLVSTSSGLRLKACSTMSNYTPLLTSKTVYPHYRHSSLAIF